MIAKYTRRSHVRSSAGGAGASPFASRPAEMKRSIPVLPGSSGTDRCCGVCHSHGSRCFRSAMSNTSRFAATPLAPGQIAPSAIHFSKSAITAAVSGFPDFAGGIARSLSSCRIALMSRLSAGFPGDSAGPESPPASNPSRESRRRPPFCFSAPWHSEQRS